MTSAQCVVTAHNLVASKTSVGSTSRPLLAIAFGTSLMWGDGLHAEHTFRYGVATWLADNTQRAVELWTFAHSAAYLTHITGGAQSPDPSNGALNGNYPPVDEQVQCAAGTEHGLGKADLVLLDGCINEVNAVDIVAPWTSADEIIQKTKESCGQSMTSVLTQVRSTFPQALIVVVGYYPIVSSKSTIFGFWGTRRVSNYADKAAGAKTSKTRRRPKARMSKDAETSSIGNNSDVFFQTAKMKLQDAVKAVDAQSPGRVFYAGLPEIQVGSEKSVNPNFAYGASETHEWLVPFQFLWWVIHPDEEYKTRSLACKSHYQADLDLADLYVCKINASFHPNVKGSQAYAQSIESVIPRATIAAWKQ
jgi:hypothetical protein